ncbi:hypothetical protein NQ317_001286 [Molorchus minor]|uniref:Uncharacterized protein n=1 Tax=Molorchus minor TaxID=1323400 RepID=A0ABQ9JPE6_9CUCU|nr:hypothetical protein NQ317_001286 [Molorchus minor]
MLLRQLRLYRIELSEFLIVYNSYQTSEEQLKYSTIYARERVLLAPEGDWLIFSLPVIPLKL